MPSSYPAERPGSPFLARLLPEADPPHARWYDRAAWLWCFAALIVILRTFDDYGITMDEAPHLGYGTQLLNWYDSGFRNTGALTFRTNYYYGGGFDLLGAMFRNLVKPMGPYSAIHLLGGLVGVLGLLGVWRLGRVLAGPRAGLIACVLLTVNPVYWGHLTNNPKDPPFAVAYVWSVAFMIAAIAALPRPSRALLARLAIAVGLALSVRVAGLLLICMFGLVLLLWAVHAGALRRSVVAFAAQLGAVSRIGVGVTLGAWLVMLLGWPWAQLDPLRRPLIALTRMSKFDAHRRLMPFAGEDIWNFDIGWDYLPHYFGLQTPEFVLVLAIVGTLYGAYTVLRYATRREQPRQVLALLLLGMAIWLPPLYAVVKGSILYDGYRHFLFVVPPLCALAAVMVELGLQRLRSRALRGALAGLVVVGVVDIGAQMVRLHPHEYVYFNRLIGGLPGAVDKYDTDYYGNSFKEAIEGLKAYLWRTEPEAYLNTVYYLTGCISMKTARYYSPPNFLSFKDRRGTKIADFQTGYTRYHCDDRYSDAPEIFRVERYGARLNIVRDLRGLPDAARLETAAFRTFRPSGARSVPVPASASAPALPVPDDDDTHENDTPAADSDSPRPARAEDSDSPRPAPAEDSDSPRPARAEDTEP
jgi:hypothetical protein